MFVKYHPMRQSIPVVPEWGLLVLLFFFIVHSWDILFKTPLTPYLLAGQYRQCNPLSSRTPLSRIRFLLSGIHMLPLPAAKSPTDQHLQNLQ